MKLFIHKLIIWPAGSEYEPRVVDFDPTKVSVVTGWSATGKSSIISIIDYVLGAGSCAIPVGVIRDAASWYGLELETDAGPMRLARRKPEGRHVSGDYWLQQGSDTQADLPGSLMPNAHADRVRSLLDALSGLSNLRVEPEGKGFSERASFRDMAAFNFLPQHIVANPYTMFFKADTYDHREKLRNVLPLALGIITNDDLARLHSLHLLREELRKLEGELKLKRNALETWRANATGSYFRAQELGLLPPGDPPKLLSALIDMLRRAVSGDAQVRGLGDRTTAAVRRLQEIQREEQRVTRRIADQKRRMKRLRSLRYSVSDYEIVLGDQSERVSGVGWFSAVAGETECILCGTPTKEAQRALDDLQASIAELETLQASTSSTTPMVDKELSALERELLADDRRLLEIRRTRQAFEAAVDAEAGRTQTLENVYRFIGSTEQALSMLADVDGEDGITKRAESLRTQIGDLVAALDENARTLREHAVARMISGYVQRFIDHLGVEGAEGVPILDYKELNLRFEREGANKSDFLWEIGSGENWMAYHLAVFLALHGVFLKRRITNPVPTFIVIDQPSQVYFPSDTFDEYVVGDGKGVDGKAVRRGRHHDDLERTRQIFSALSRAQRSFEGNLQIIVLDHADRNAWGEHQNVRGVANWRNDEDALIPYRWLGGR
jgi:hypothetical protein